MEGSGGNWRPTHSDGSAMPMDASASADWRTQMPPGARTRIVNKIVNKIADCLQRHLPDDEADWLPELRKIAMRYEEKVLAVACSQAEYLRKIETKLLEMELNCQNTGNGSQLSSNPSDQINPEGAPISQAQGQNTMPMTNQWQPGQQAGVQGSGMVLTVDELPQSMPSIGQPSNWETLPGDREKQMTGFPDAGDVGPSYAQSLAAGTPGPSASPSLADESSSSSDEAPLPASAAVRASPRHTLRLLHTLRYSRPSNLTSQHFLLPRGRRLRRRSSHHLLLSRRLHRRRCYFESLLHPRRRSLPLSYHRRRVHFDAAPIFPFPSPRLFRRRHLL